MEADTNNNIVVSEGDWTEMPSANQRMSENVIDTPTKNTMNVQNAIVQDVKPTVMPIVATINPYVYVPVDDIATIYNQIVSYKKRNIK